MKLAIATGATGLLGLGVAKTLQEAKESDPDFPARKTISTGVAMMGVIWAVALL